MSIQSDIFASDQYLIDVNPRILAIWDILHGHECINWQIIMLLLQVICVVIHFSWSILSNHISFMAVWLDLYL